MKIISNRNKGPEETKEKIVIKPELETVPEESKEIETPMMGVDYLDDEDNDFLAEARAQQETSDNRIQLPVKMP